MLHISPLIKAIRCYVHAKMPRSQSGRRDMYPLLEYHEKVCNMFHLFSDLMPIPYILQHRDNSGGGGGGFVGHFAFTFYMNLYLKKQIQVFTSYFRLTIISKYEI